MSFLTPTAASRTTPGHTMEAPVTPHSSESDDQMALVPGVHEGAAADLASAVRAAATVGAAIFSLATTGAATKVDFFDAVRASLPLDPPIVSSRSWDALLDSLRGGIEEIGAALIVITWTGAADLRSASPADYDIAIEVLRAVTSDVGNEKYTVGKPKQVCVYVA